MQRLFAGAFLVAVLPLALGGFGNAPRVGVLTPDGSSPFALMDLAQPISLDPVAEGWRHRVFRRHPPMDLSFTRKDGVAALRMETRDSVSMHSIPYVAEVRGAHR
jgi:hypothetical protein